MLFHLGGGGFGVGAVLVIAFGTGYKEHNNGYINIEEGINSPTSHQPLVASRASDEC